MNIIQEKKINQTLTLAEMSNNYYKYIQRIKGKYNDNVKTNKDISNQVLFSNTILQWKAESLEKLLRLGNIPGEPGLERLVVPESKKALQKKKKEQERKNRENNTIWVLIRF